MELDELLTQPPYDQPASQKQAMLLPMLSELTQLHSQRCSDYGRGVEVMFPAWRTAGNLAELPYSPVRMFKQRELRSIEPEQVFKVMTSSGTAGDVSRIFLDAETAKRQTIALSQIMQSFLGSKRLPMLILDCSSVIKDRKNFSARGAGILGMMNFGRGHAYALNDDMTLNRDALAAWLDAHQGQPTLMFGFTFMVWKYFYQAILADNDLKINLEHSTLVHSGGWKKLADEAVSNDDFKAALTDRTGLSRVHNFYGMVEQVGSVFVECEQGCFHAPLTGDVLVRDKESLASLPPGQRGIVQVLSLLPRSYPGHSLLTEDEGTILGIDDCRCGRLGTRFLIHGRLPRAEVRGCSDTHAAATIGAGSND